MKVLYIASNTPYEHVGHAGGKTLQFYISNMVKKGVTIDLVSFCEKDVVNDINNDKTNINRHLIIRERGIKNSIRNVISIPSKFWPWHRYGNLMTWNAKNLLINELKKLKSTGYYPDVIVMDWTQIVIMVADIKKIFSDVPCIASEHDVTFLKYIRSANHEKNLLLRCYRNIQANNMRKRELDALSLCDVIMPHNNKDAKLIIESGFKGESLIHPLTAYYDKSNLDYKRDSNDIIFYGYMARVENLSAVEWFARNVMPLIDDIPCRFLIIGGGVTDKLKSLESEKIHIQGYVDKIDPYFSKGMCFVAPLSLGAGIKVKVLEAMYTGIPVLTNDIGIEGIPAEKDLDYYHCDTPEQYAEIIRNIYSSRENDFILANGKPCIEKNFDLEKSFDEYYDIIVKLSNKKGD
ncbi:MAG: glycosyltransferase [Eubacteriales bacterium]|nr:glycosyltransferase [Eubacteriales bacterium]